MSVAGGPRIPTSNIALYLDAGNTKSYPTTGATWYDLSPNKYNGTLVNGPTFSSENKGSIVFDSTNDHFIGNFACEKLYYSIDLWLYPTVVSDYNWGISFNGIGWGGFTMHTTVNGEVYIGTTAVSRMTPWRSNVFVLSAWQNFTWTFNNGNGTFYRNGRYENLANMTASPYSSFTTFQSASSSNTTTGNIALFRVHSNRVLTPTEVLQGYNSFKGRFGL